MPAPVKTKIQQIVELMATMWMGVTVPNLTNRDVLTHVNAYVSSKESATALPFVVIEPYGGAVDIRAGAMMNVKDKLKCYLCLDKAGSGADLKDLLEQATYWRDPVFVYFAGNLRLGGSLDFLTIAYISAWDVKQYHTGDVDYLALLFEFVVEENWPITVSP